MRGIRNIKHITRILRTHRINSPREALSTAALRRVEFVDSQAYFDVLMLPDIYRGVWEVSVPTFRIFEDFDWIM